MLPQMRTIDGFYEELVQEDPRTAATRKMIRRVIVNGTVPSVKVGRKYLFDKEKMMDYLRGTTTQEAAPEPRCGVIRQIPER